MRLQAITVPAVALLGVVALLASGCGTSGGPKAHKPTPVIPSNSASADRSVLTPGNCAQLIDLPETFSDGLTGVNDGLAKTRTVLLALAGKSLIDLRPDFDLLAAAAAKIETALKGVNLTNAPTAAEIAKVRKLSTEIDTDTVTNDSSFISDWAQRNCLHR